LTGLAFLQEFRELARKGEWTCKKQFNHGWTHLLQKEQSYGGQARIARIRTKTDRNRTDRHTQSPVINYR